MAGGNVVRFASSFDTKPVEAGIKRVDQGMSGLSAKGVAAGAAVGTVFGLAITKGLTAAAKAFPAVIQAASDLNETQSKVGVVFGTSAQKVLAFGKAASTALGLSENDAEAAAATFGNLFTAMGLAESKSADMSLKLVQLAGDLASFNNLDPTDVLEKLRAGLTGESEPLKSLGVNINETIIKAEALKLGLVQTTASTTELTLKQIALNDATKAAADATKKYGAGSIEALKATDKMEQAQSDLEAATNKIPVTLDAATKAQAAYALIFEQTSKAQGDFGRTSGGLANQQRILRATVANTAAVIGTALLPKVTEVVKKVNELIVGHQPEIAAFAAALPGVFDHLVNVVSALPWGAIKSAFEAMGTGAQAALDVFTNTPDWLQAAVLTGWGLNKLTGGTVIKAVFDLFGSRGSSPVNPVWVQSAGGLPGGAPMGGKGWLASLFPAIALAALIDVVATEFVGPVVSSWAKDHGLAGRPGDEGKTDSQLARERADKAMADALHELPGKMADDIVGTLNLITRFPGKQADDTAMADALKAQAKPQWLIDWENSLGPAVDATHKAIAAALDAVTGGTATINDLNTLGRTATTSNEVNLRQRIGALETFKATQTDPAIIAATDAAIAKMTAVLPRQDQIAAAYRKSEEIARSTESTADKVKDLTQIKIDMAKVSPTVAERIGALITAVQNLPAQISASIRYGAGTPTVNPYTGFNTTPSTSSTGSIVVNPYTGFHASGGIQYADKATGAIFGEVGSELGVFMRNPRPGMLGGVAPIVQLFLDSRQITVRQRRGDVWHNTVAQ